MSKFFLLSRISHSLRHVRCFRFLFGTRYGRHLILAAACALMIIMNIATLSVAATRGYYLKNLDARLTEFKKDNQKLNLEISTRFSPKTLEEKAQSLGMVSASDIKYLSPTANVLVVNTQ